MVRKWLGLAMAVALLAALFPATMFAANPTRGGAALPNRIANPLGGKHITLSGDQLDGILPARIAAMRGLKGTQRVIVRLTAPAAVRSFSRTEAEQQSAYRTARAQQARVIAKAKAIDSSVKVLGRTGLASNVVMLKADAKTLRKLAASRDVVSIVPVKDYTLDLSETVPYVGAKIVQGKGYSGAGVDVAILDTGIDYTHAALGGAGTEAAYTAAYGTSIDDPNTYNTDTTFPTSRVKGGYDFTGEYWPAYGDEAPDPDPIDSPAAGVSISGWSGPATSGGHGTHVADIIGGKLGMAPKANLYAVKVCSSVSSSCSGIALINAMDWAMDPNGDGSMADHVDVINMSLGSDYGAPYDDDLSMAVEFATKNAGILTVAASGNGGNKPWISGTPAAAPSALSVAQTQVPSAVKYPLVISAPAGIAGTYKNVESVDWAPIGSGFAGDVVYAGGNGCPGDPSYTTTPGTYTGKVVLIDRGACAVSLKTDGAAQAGAAAVLIGLVAPGDAVQFSYGGGSAFVPTLVIQQSLSSAIKSALGSATVTVSVSGSATVALVGGVVGSSSRGPSLSNRIKPEIGAPGASVSAVSGSGTETEAFGGTSGATPMVAGAVALLRGAFPGRTPLEIKAVLMNTAEIDINTDNAVAPTRAPITRIGGGELRVNRALASPIAIWDASGQSGSISFGFVDGSKTISMSRVLTLRNYSSKALTYKVKPTFRYAADKASGAVTISAPSQVTVGAKATTTVKVKITIDSSKLADWALNGTSAAMDPAALDAMEFDGYVKFDRVDYKGDDADPAHVAWQVLPRKSADVSLTGGNTIEATSLPVTVDVVNNGAGTAASDYYSLVGTSPKLPGSRPGMNAPVIDLKAVGVMTIPTEAGFCGTDPGFIYSVALSTWERHTSAAVPGQVGVDIDTDDDSIPEYTVFGAPYSIGALSNIYMLTWVYDWATDTADSWLFTADNATNDSNTELWFCGDQVGATQANFGDPWTMTAWAADWYFSGNTTDVITDIQVTPYGEHYGVENYDDVAANSTGTIDVVDWSGFYAYPANPSETGILVVNNAWRPDFTGGSVKGNDNILITIHNPS